MKKIILLVLVFTFFRCTLTENILKEPIWYRPIECYESKCLFEAEFNNVTLNSQLYINGSKVGDLQFRQLYNRLRLKRDYDFHDITVVSTITGNQEFPYGTQQYVYSDNIFASAMKIDSMNTFTQIKLNDEIFDISESGYYENGGFKFNTRNFKHGNISNFHTDKKIVNFWSDTSENLIMLCDANKLGEHNTSKFGILNSLPGGNATENFNGTGLSSSSSKLMTDYMYIKEGSSFKLTSTPLVPIIGSSQSLVLPTFCNLSWSNGMLKANESCKVIIKYVSSIPEFTITFTELKPLLPLFFMNDSIVIIPDLLNEDYTFRLATNRNKGQFGIFEYRPYFTSLVLNSTCTVRQEVSFGSGFNNNTMTSGQQYQVLAGYDLPLSDYESNLTHYGGEIVDGIFKSNGTECTLVNGTCQAVMHCLVLPDINLGWYGDLVLHMNMIPTNHILFHVDRLGQSVSEYTYYFSQNDTISVGTPGIKQICIIHQKGSIAETSYAEIDLTQIKTRQTNDSNGIVRFKIYTTSQGCLGYVSFHGVIGTMGASAETNVVHDKSISNVVSTISSKCSFIPITTTGDKFVDQIVTERKFGSDNLTILTPHYLDELNTFDPYLDITGYFVGPNISSVGCVKFKSVVHNQVSKDQLESTIKFDNQCDQELYFNVTIGEVLNKYLSKNQCFNISTKATCVIKGDLQSSESFTLTTNAWNSYDIINDKKTVKYDFSEDCVLFCETALADYPEWFKWMIIIIVCGGVLFCLVTMVYPIIVVWNLLCKIFGWTWWIICCFAAPFMFCFKKSSSKIIQRWKTKSQQYYKKVEEVTEGKIANAGNNSTFSTLLIICICIPCVLTCDYIPIQETNITSCLNGVCNLKLDVTLDMPSTDHTSACMLLNTYESELGDVTFAQESLNVTVVDLFWEFPITQEYFSPWISTILAKSGCDCPDGSDHECSSSHHPSGSGCSGDYCAYKKTSGTGDNCDSLLLFGDGHYCSSFTFVQDPGVEVDIISENYVQKMKLQVCKKDSSEIVCEYAWSNGTSKNTISMFENQVTLIIDGFLNLPDIDFNSKRLIKTSGNCWIADTNAKGDYEASQPGFLQYYQSDGKFQWHWAFSLIENQIGISHKKCYSEAKVDYTYKFPVFASYLTEEKTIQSVLGKYGKVECYGWNGTTTVKVHPVSSSNFLSELITKPGWMQVNINSACPYIGLITGESLYIGNQKSYLNVQAYSTCGEGESEITVSCSKGCEDGETLNVILEPELDTYPVPLTVKESDIAGQVCIQSYTEDSRKCKDFQFTVGFEDFDDGVVISTSNSTSDNDESDDLCLLCWDSWLSFETSWDTLTEIGESLLKIIVYAVIFGIGGVIALVLLWDLLDWMVMKIINRIKKRKLQ